MSLNFLEERVKNYLLSSAVEKGYQGIDVNIQVNVIQGYAYYQGFFINRDFEENIKKRPFPVGGLYFFLNIN